MAAYELGTREPSLATLAALVDSTGVALTVGLGSKLPVPRQVSTGPIGHRLRRHRAAVLAVAEKHGVSDVRVFGSVARGEEGEDSDLDLLVRLPDGVGLFALARFKHELEELLRVSVDVIPDEGVKPRLRASIDEDLVRL